MAPRGKRFTIFDAMENRGVFEANPANPGSRDHEGKSLYNGPVELPRMVYHPEGRERITVPATPEQTPFGPKWVGEQREVIFEIVHSLDEYKRLKAAGWHDHPAKAIAAGNKLVDAASARPVPPISSIETISDLEKQLAEMTAKLAEAQANREVSAPAASSAITDKLKAKVAASGLA